MSNKHNEFSIGEAIDLFLNKQGIKEKSLVQRVVSDWERIMGKPIADNTEKVWFNKGTFYVKMNHPTWKSELLMGREKIRQLLNKEIGAELIKEVRIF